MGRSTCRLLVVVSITLAAVTAEAAPIYAPSGPQANVAKAVVEAGGWTLCFSEGYNSSGTSIPGILAGCAGDLLMLAGGVTNDPNLLALAWAAEADVTFATGGFTSPTTVHNANGTSWYFDPNWSWGFAPQGAPVFQNSCDYGDDPTATASVTPDPLRLCWHTGDNTLSGGWRVGTHNGNAEDMTGFTRYVYTANSAPSVVPEPTSLLLFGSGAAALAAKARRRKKEHR